MPTVIIRPNGNSVVNLTPSAGTNWQCVSDSNDTTYVRAASAYTYDTYTLDDISGEGFIKTVMVYARLSGSGGSPFASISCDKLGGSLQTNINSTVSTYGTSLTVPTGLKISDLNAGKITVYLDGSGGVANCHDVWLEVEYVAANDSIFKYNGVAATGLAKINGVALASIAKVNGIG